MREHKYKAKRLDNGEWIEGYLWRGTQANYYIRKEIGFAYAKMVDFKVDPDTICEFTGLLDKNNKWIWENDVLDIDGRYCLVSYGEWNCGCCYDVYGWVANYEGFCDNKNKSIGKVIGNILENPELLESK